jgi:hypothetical protein
MERKRFDFEIKAIDEAGRFEGWASVYGNKDHGGDVVLPGAFDESLANWQGAGRKVPILHNHDHSDIRGVWEVLESRDKGLWGQGQLNLDIEAGRDSRALMKQGAISGLSIGYNIEDGGISYDEEKQTYLLSKLNLWEVSIVTFPMNDLARVEVVKSKNERRTVPTVREIERALRDQGFTSSQSKQIAKVASGTLSQGEEPSREGDTEVLLGAVEGLLKQMAIN